MVNQYTFVWQGRLGACLVLKLGDHLETFPIGITVNLNNQLQDVCNWHIRFSDLRLRTFRESKNQYFINYIIPIIKPYII